MSHQALPYQGKATVDPWKIRLQRITNTAANVERRQTAAHRSRYRWCPGMKLKIDDLPSVVLRRAG